MVRIALIISFLILPFGIKAQYKIEKNIQQKLLSNYFEENYISDSLNSIQDIINLEYNNNFNVTKVKLNPIEPKIEYPNISFNYAMLKIKLKTIDSTQGFNCIMLIDSLFVVKDFFLINTYIKIDNNIFAISDAIPINTITLYYYKIKNQDYSMHPYMTEILYKHEITIDTLAQKFVYWKNNQWWNSLTTKLGFIIYG